MPLLDTSSLLVLIDDESNAGLAIFHSPENAKYRYCGLVRDALTDGDDDDDDAPSETDFDSHMVDGNGHPHVFLALSFNLGPKDVSKGFVFGSDPETCDVLLAKDKTSGVSGNYFSINVDWATGNPLITCLAPNDRSGIRILSGSTWELYSRTAWQVVEPGTVTTIKISENINLAIHTPSRESREPAYSNGLQGYLKRCHDAVPEMTQLKLYDPEPTPLLVSRGRGVTGMEYFTTSTIVGEHIVLCEAKSRQSWAGDAKIFITKRFRYVTDKWQHYAQTDLRSYPRLRHRHIVPLEDIITDRADCMPVYLPEPPETLTDRQTREPLTEIEAGRVLAQVLEGLEFLHANGIIHGGLCPSSIRIEHSDPWLIKLSDIGLHPYVGLENANERQLYASQPNEGYPKLLAMLDTWSAGAVGLSLLCPDGLPPYRRHQTFKPAVYTITVAERATAFLGTERAGPGGRRDAALFLTRVLKVDFAERPTAEECLQDPWITRWQLPPSHNEKGFQNPDDVFHDDPGSGRSWSCHSEGGSVYKEDSSGDTETGTSGDEEDSDEDTETEEPPTRISKGKQPQTSRHTSVASSSNPYRQRSNSPQSLLFPKDTPRTPYRQRSTSPQSLRSPKDTPRTPYRQESTSPQSFRSSRGTPRQYRHTTVEPSESISRQGSVAPGGASDEEGYTQQYHQAHAGPSSTVSSTAATDGSAHPDYYSRQSLMEGLYRRQ